MSLTSFEVALNTWLRNTPSFSGIPECDALSLTSHVRSGDDLIALLAPRTERSREQSISAELIRETCRGLRRSFMRLNAVWLYDALTDRRINSKTLLELASDAAHFCPGLVPTPAQIASERTRQQANKEKYELDQGIFFHALLSNKEVGAHLIESALQPRPRSLGLIEQFKKEARANLGSVLLERIGCAAHLTVNNQYCLNAEDDRLVDDIETAVDLALMDDEISVGVLRGGVMTHPRYAGKRVFSSGINLKALGAGQISFVDFLLRRELGFINKIVRGLRVAKQSEIICPRSSVDSLEKPWIACVDGFAIGGGAQLLLVFDHVIAASDSYISLPAAQEGIVPGFANLRLTRLLGARKARQLILYGRKISVQDPDASLLVDEVVNSVDLSAAVDRSIRQLSSPAVVANRHMINLAEEPLSAFQDYAAEFALRQSERLYSQDVLEKVNRKMTASIL